MSEPGAAPPRPKGCLVLTCPNTSKETPFHGPLCVLCARALQGSSILDPDGRPAMNLTRLRIIESVTAGFTEEEEGDA